MTDTENPLLFLVAKRDQEIADLKDTVASYTASRASIIDRHRAQINSVKEIIKDNLNEDGLNRDEVIEIATILGIDLKRTMHITGTFEATVEIPIDYDGDLYSGWTITMSRDWDDAEVVSEDYTVDNVQEED